MPNSFDEYNSVFLGKLETLLEFSLESTNQIIGVIEYYHKAQKFWICSTNTKPFSWKCEAIVETLQEIFSHIRVTYKLFLESLKVLKRIFWVIEYCYKAKKCQICSANTKPFSGESEANLEL